MVVRLWILVVLIIGCCACTNSPSSTASPTSETSRNPLLVAAASDLIPAFEELGALFTAQTGVAVVFNFGSTGQLAQQIEQGAPVDVFAAANVSFINTLQSAGLVLEDSIMTYAFGRLTLWTRSDSPVQITTLEDLIQLDIQRIAIANPEHAPYGIAAREALQSAGVWEAVQPQLIFGENIAQTLQYAETGNVDVALVALSLSIAAGESGRWVLIPDTLHNPLQQTLAVIKGTQHEAAARQFALFVNSDAGRAVMQRFGFILPDEKPME